MVEHFSQNPRKRGKKHHKMHTGEQSLRASTNIAEGCIIVSSLERMNNSKRTRKAGSCSEMELTQSGFRRLPRN